MMPYRRLAFLFLIQFLLACDSSPQAPASVQPKPRSVEYPWMSIERWYRMHSEDVGVAAQGQAELLFIGDSITEGWPEHLMEQYFAAYKPANFGIGGDQTDNLLWRLQNGSVGQLQPRVVSLLIGVNNFGLRGDAPSDVVMGIQAVTAELQSAFPQSHIILHGIFPYRESADSPERTWVRAVNSEISALAAAPNIHFIDIGPQLVKPNGQIAEEIMPDFLHLSEQGYQIWADELMPLVARLFAQE